jgi:hypothetical protein
MKKLLLLPLLFLGYFCIAQTTKPTRIIGKSIVLGNLEIAEYDFSVKLNFYESKLACTSLGDGWRLPTIDELDFINKHQGKIKHLKNETYWSSTEVDLNEPQWSGTEYKAPMFKLIWFKNSLFLRGAVSEPNDKNYTRAVRSL